MNRSVKRGILIIIIIQLIASSISLLYFYLDFYPNITIPKEYFAVTDDNAPYLITPNDHFSKLPFAIAAGYDKLPSTITFTNNESVPAEHFRDDKLSTPVLSSDGIPSSIASSDKLSSFGSNKHFSNNKSSSLHEFSQQAKANSAVKIEIPDKLPQSVINHIKTFVFFVGHARSGHSIVASLMDSHPHMVISHEYDLFTKLSRGSIAPNRITIFNALWQSTKQTIINGSRARSTNYKGYTLFVDGLYQGKYVNHIDVIGDKKGGSTTNLLANHQQSWLKSFNVLKSFNLSMKVVHVVRNPYDSIATFVLYIATGEYSFGKFRQSNKTIKVDSTLVNKHIQTYFVLQKAIVEATKTYNLDVIEIHGKDLLSDPKGTLLKICRSLGVTCSDKYLEICNNKLYKSESKTRHMLEWTEEQLKMIQQNIDKYSNLKDYNFHSM